VDEKILPLFLAAYYGILKEMLLFFRIHGSE
jgi:hypothetical protein